MLMESDAIKEIKRRALEISAELDEKLGPYRAEIIPGCTPHWHIVTCHPAHEDSAADYLMDRGFGVFVPRFMPGTQLRIPVPPEKRNRFNREAWETFDLSDKLIFPGRLLIFVWDVLAHWRRIAACPGVGGVMVDGMERPIVVPDHEVATIQLMQFRLVPNKPNRRKERKREYVQGDRMVVSTRSYWHVDGEQRNRLLDKALGLAS